VGEGGAAGGDGPVRPAPAVEALLEQAHRLGDEGDWEGMARLLAEALGSHPEDPFVLCWLGVAERELGLEGLAYDHFKACLSANPRDPHVLATAGAGVAAFDDPDAEPALRTAAMLAPELPMARWHYGAYLSREGFVEQALEELQAARALDPSEPAVSYELGVALALAGNVDGAVDELYRASELDPGDAWTRVVLGLALLEADRLDDALPELVAGARGRPEDDEAQLLAAGAEGDEELAWEMLERGRLVHGAGGLHEAVEERLDAGRGAARSFLLAEFSPAAWRQRLGRRP
jgi:tetratricopeptide (TPR) repeat protein